MQGHSLRMTDFWVFKGFQRIMKDKSRKGIYCDGTDLFQRIFELFEFSIFVPENS